MAQIEWQAKFHSIFKKDLSLKCKILQPCNVLYINRSNKKIGRLIVQCSSSFPVSLRTRREEEEEVGLKHNVEVGNVGNEVDCFVNENGWKVRTIIETKQEMTKVAAIQAQAFHKPTLFHFFKEKQSELEKKGKIIVKPLKEGEPWSDGKIVSAYRSRVRAMEVTTNAFIRTKLLSELVNRLRNSTPDRYACLVAEPSRDNSDIVGVVNATVLKDKDVLHYFPEAEEYLYISGIAVLNQFRRQKVATALLKACDVLARFWGFEYLVLRAYEDGFGARQLYTNAGYSVVSSDPLWNSTLTGRRRRVLMVKQVSHESTNIQ